MVALAETVAATQQALDDAARAAVAAERAARAAVDEGPDPTRVEHWITLRERVDGGRAGRGRRGRRRRGGA